MSTPESKADEVVDLSPITIASAKTASTKLYDAYEKVLQDYEKAKVEFEEAFDDLSRRERTSNWVLSTKNNIKESPFTAAKSPDTGNPIKSQRNRSAISISSGSTNSSRLKSERSSKSSKAKVNLEKKEMEYKQLLQRQQTERQIAEIKRQQSKALAEMQEKEEELNRQLALLDAQTEVQKAKIKEESSMASRNDRDSSDSSTLEQILKQQQETMLQMVNSVRSGFEMPKRELLTFDGDPVNYWTFINNFETNIAKRVPDAETKLSYLIQHCIGKARESIKNCVIIPNKDEAYKKAKDILHTRYGQKHVIAHAYINRLVNGPQLRSTDNAGLSELALQMQNCQLTLGTMGFEADINSSDNLVKIVKRLPVHLQSKWADKAGTLIQNGKEPRFDHLVKFVEERSTLANTMYGQLVGSSPDKDNSTKHKPARPPTSIQRRATTFTTTSSNGNSQDTPKNLIQNCPLCSSPHKLTRCEKFKEKTPQSRRDFVIQSKLCLNCLGRNHVASECRSENTCKVPGCSQRHHTYLHPPKDKPTATESRNTPNSTSQATPNQAIPGQASGAGVCGATGGGTKTRVSLRTVPVTVTGHCDEVELTTYALLDPGSDVSLCSNSLIEQLGIQGTQATFSLTTVNGQLSERKGLEVALNVKGIESDETIELNKVWSVDKLSISKKNIPSPEDLKHWSHLQGINLQSVDEKEVNILIGSDVPEAHWVLDQRRGKKGQPYAILTPLGWTLMGPIGTTASDSFSVNAILQDDVSLHQQLQRMFKEDFNEPMVDSKVTMSVDDRKAIHQMKKSVQVVDGHYQVDLPWKNTDIRLPNNRVLAEKRLNLLKKRLQKDEHLLDKYRETVNSYLDNNYARVVPDGEVTTNNERTWYLPHHPVVHPLKPDKVRVVFDCAARYQNTSLNDNLLQGPDLTNSLVAVLIRFRQEQIAIASDIKAMFHQVRVNPKDRDSLRFLWWPKGDLSQEPKDHQMQVHIFGATSSPSCANFCLRRVADDNEEDFDAETLDTVHRNFYVDDCLKSVSTTEQAVKLTSELRELLSRGGFNLTKWISNDKEVLASIPKSERASSVLDLDFESLPVEHTLGLQWDMQTDTFNFRAVKKEATPTRRKILSVVSSLYDPLGFVAPVILPAKQVLQRLCSQNYGWDDIVPQSELTEWQSWINNLPKLQEISVQRCFKSQGFGKLKEAQLHHFSDASQTGYGACSYLRLVDENDNVHCSLVIGKSRVTPMKTISIPRLELSAAVISVKLHTLILEELECPIKSTVYWTDSTSVLRYIRNQSRRFQTFVANRVAMIQDASAVSQWRHVSTDNNPADIASRGIKAGDTSKLKQWLSGPDFLWESESKWPAQPEFLKDLPPDDPEVKGESKQAQVNVITQERGVHSLLLYYSSWYPLQKAIAWMVRFKEYLCSKYLPSKSHVAPTKGPITVQEIKNATKNIVIIVQKQSFPREYTMLKNPPAAISEKADKFTSGRYSKKSLPKDSTLRKLNPVLSDNILRVGGRLERAPIAFNMKHPIILPNKHHVSELVIRHYHVLEGHCGPTHVLSSVRQRFWIVQGHSAVRRVIGNCIDCKKRNARPGQQIMAPLPTARLIPFEPPFTRVGVDYFGPLHVKQGRSQVKRYGCLFTCMSVRAVHIEIAHSLEADSFICAYQRFVSRRGKPKEIFSDNGTNFKGGERELREALERWNQDKINDRLRQDEVQWNFNPPEASHQGGVWERMIKSVRKILNSLMKEQVVSDETLLTLMAEVEKIINDRPITEMSNSSEDPEPLTPSKLLLLKDNSSVPYDIVEKEDVYNKRWRAAQCMANAFWKRWIREYLPSLQYRQKWTKPYRNFAVGDLVLIIDDRVSRGNWPMAIIEEVYPDKHGVVRQVKLKTSTNNLKRDVRKLCLLEGHMH